MLYKFSWVLRFLKKRFPVLLLFVIFGIRVPTPDLSAYVCNSGTTGAVKVTIEQPDPLENPLEPKEVKTLFENTSGKPVNLTLRYRTLAPLFFPASKENSKQTLSEIITIPGKTKTIFSVKIAAGKGAFSAHYPVNLDIYSEHGLKNSSTPDGSKTNNQPNTKPLNIVYPIETKLPANNHWKIDDLPLFRTTEDWDSSRWQNPQGKTIRFELDNNRFAAVVPGQLGLADALVSVESNGRTVRWQGLRIFVAGRPLYQQNPGIFQEIPGKKNCWTQTFRYKDKEYKLFYEIRKNKGTIQFKIDCSEPEALTWLEFGPCSSDLDAVNLGHGYYIKRPGKFSITSNGHSFSTSFVGIDYTNGASVVMASDFMIHSFRYDPLKKQQTITVPGPAVLTLVPGSVDQGGSMSCAIRYRSVLDKKPASGVQAKQGRFVLDLWNGHYSQQTKLIQDAAELYGLRNDLILITHNWQRFRYDHRLPDVWPPNPLFGSRDDLIETLKTAQKNGWYFGTHNNVIDYYPDSTSFSFDNVSFLPDGTPQKAYRNVFLQAQSYRLAPNKAADILGTCLRQMNNDGFAMNCCFVDVLACVPAHAARNYYDQYGKTISHLKAIKDVGNVFNNIHKIQNPVLEKEGVKERQSITVSEGGHDYLIGSLDGADCQFVNLGTKSGEYCWFNIPSFDDAEKIPWFDAVNHQLFSLHGAGYSVRYEGGRGRELHGIDSDDYISTELMTGHALMSDGYCRDVKEILSGYVRSLPHNLALRQLVRKYYLAQGVMRELANDEIVRFEFIDGNIHRQKIDWRGGMSIYVNRDSQDWTVDGITLPPFGYLARNKKTGTESMIRKIDGQIAEQSSWKENGKLIRYINGRNRALDKLIPVSPKANLITGQSKKIKITIDWIPYKNKPVPKEKFQISFFWVKRKNAETSLLPDFLLGTIETDLNQKTVAEFDPPQTNFGRYDLLVGISPLKSDVLNIDHRMKMLATPSFFYRYHLGEVNYTKKDLAFTPFEEKDQALYERLFPPEKEINFGFCQTKGGFRLEYDSSGKKLLRVIQLPGEPGTSLKITEK